MINYRFIIVDSHAKCLQIQSGEVSDAGDIVIDIPKEGAKGQLRIQWEVTDGNHSNDQLRID